MARRQATASSEFGAVQAIEICGELHLGRYAPSPMGELGNKGRFEALFARAAGKLGWRRDRRCQSGWRKVGV